MEAVGLGRSVLLVRARSWTCALRIEDAIETMRPLPIQSVTGVPDFVLGVSIVRGKPLPVLDVAAILCGNERCRSHRFLVMRAGPRQVVLAVDEVVGVWQVDLALLESAPPLLRDALPANVQKLGILDGHVLAVLQAGHLLSDEVWQRLAPQGVA